MAKIGRLLFDAEKPRPQSFAPAASLESQVIEQMLANGVTPPPQVVADGRLHRYAADGKGDKNCWYVIFADGVPAGRFGDWRLHDAHGVSFVAQSGGQGCRTTLTPKERAEIDARIEQRRMQDAKDKDQVAAICKIMWDYAPAAPADHPYLISKKIQPHCARQLGDALLLPMSNDAGEIRSLQTIFPDGKKKFEDGGGMSGCFTVLGDWPQDGAQIYLAEGFATGASVQEATGGCVLVAFNAGNLVPVLGTIRQYAGYEVVARRVVIVADNDESGDGEKWARRAAEKHGADVVLIPKLGDANDYANAGGDLAGLLEVQLSSNPCQLPLQSAWLKSARELCQTPAPINWVVKGWIQAGTVIMIHGPASTGKTFFALDLCCHVASGREWNSKRVKQGAIIYLAGEGNYGVRKRLMAWRQHHKVDDIGDLWVSESGCDLDHTDGMDRVTQNIDLVTGEVSVIVVDTLHRFFSGDENSSADAKRMIDACEKLRIRYGCAVILIHHTGNDEKNYLRPRGSSAWDGSVGIRIALVPGKARSDPTTISMPKAKDSEPAKPISMTTAVVEIEGWINEDGEQETSLVAQYGERQDAATTGFERQRVDTKLEEAKRLFERAWWATEEGSRGGVPFVDAVAMRNYLMSQQGKTRRVAEGMIDPADDEKFIGRLLAAKVIETVDGGWLLREEGMILALREAAKRTSV